MDFKIKNMHAVADYRVTILLEDAPELGAEFEPRNIRPEILDAVYRLKRSGSVQYWTLIELKLTGPQALPYGRTGTEHYTATWYVGVSGDVQIDRDLPLWLDNLLNEQRPSGHLRGLPIEAF